MRQSSRGNFHTGIFTRQFSRDLRHSRRHRRARKSYEFSRIFASPLRSAAIFSRRETPISYVPLRLTPRPSVVRGPNRDTEVPPRCKSSSDADTRCLPRGRVGEGGRRGGRDIRFYDYPFLRPLRVFCTEVLLNYQSGRNDQF